VVIQRSETAESGQIVVALIDNNEVTLKRLRRRGDSIALEPANKDYETRIFGPDRVKVQGRLIGLIRRSDAASLSGGRTNAPTLLAEKGERKRCAFIELS
jgi:hypothetical protein